MTVQRLTAFATWIACALVPLAALAQESASSSSPAASVGTATITIEQTGPEEGVYATWSLLKPDFKRVEMGKKPAHTFPTMPAGNYSFFSVLPDGASAQLTITMNGEPKSPVAVPQLSFTVGDGDTISLAVTYTYTRVGKISVHSDPPGLSFSMQGVNERTYTGTTPSEFLHMPEGLYALTFDPIEDCAAPPTKSGKLVKNGRIDFSVTIVCEHLDRLAQTRIEQRTLQYVTVTIKGVLVTFDDVPLGTWFASHVHTAIRTGIMSGYRNDDGTLSGRFGPGDAVTLAQLAKVAHELSAINERENRSAPQNDRARGTWFSDYYASAERRDWLVYRNTRDDPERPATRSEVVCTLLQALDVPRLWPKGARFSDVTRRTPYADCIETAAADGLVGGDTDDHGVLTGTFSPDRPVNRAELSKMLTTAMELYGEDTAEVRRSYVEE
jgi:hypothetical protein